MLDNEAKRKIDSCRDILVGRIPDPKGQIEQITIALIYKFMNDMDNNSLKMGGKASFFTGEWERFSWRKLMDTKLGANDRLTLYSDAISRMQENERIPQLFRDIFKNAFLPYRAPDTLTMFLKEIDGFSYDNSETLGNAYEYLLSVLSSQGDAGQFRTPRHIIDFIVDVVDPQKDETILDPACGSAGFLISSFKHISDANKDAKGNSSLRPNEKKALADNIQGYDIDPLMVRLSMVNLHLHGFTSPHIYNYDTLSDETRWSESFDVILANPPFMSPKGGITPHKRFRVQSKRSEVLFVDYIAEHLNAKGRAGVIVPEGVIFQSGTAYKQLRKMLVDDYLVAVVSLPAGIFNPYSGVKTSIFIFDKPLARKTKTVAFFKVQNDGYGLGAQRREIDKNDLPQVKADVAEYLRLLRAGKPVDEFQSAFGLVVSKEKLAANGDYNLSGERYGDQTRLLKTNWSTVSLGEICTFMTGGTPTSTVPEYYEGGTIPWLVSGDIHGFEIFDCAKRITQKAVQNSNARVLPRDSVLIALNGQGKTRGTVALLRMEGATCNQSLVAITPANSSRAISEFIFWILRSMYSDIRALTGDTERSGLNIPILKSIQIPLPPLEVQKEIVAEIEGYQKVIGGARAVVDNYRPHIPIDSEWPMVELGECCDIKSGGTPSRAEATYWNGTIPWVGSTVCKDGEVTKAEEFITEEGLNNSAAKLLPENTTLIALVGATIGKTGLLKFECATNQNVAGLYPKSKELLEPIYLFHAVRLLYPEFLRLGEGKFRMANLSFIREQRIALPPLATQQFIVAEIEAEQALVNANKELTERFEKKIQATLARVWGKELAISEKE